MRPTTFKRQQPTSRLKKSKHCRLEPRRRWPKRPKTRVLRNDETSDDLQQEDAKEEQDRALATRGDHRVEVPLSALLPFNGPGDRTSVHAGDDSIGDSSRQDRVDADPSVSQQTKTSQEDKEYDPMKRDQDNANQATANATATTSSSANTLPVKHRQAALLRRCIKELPKYLRCGRKISGHLVFVLLSSDDQHQPASESSVVLDRGEIYVVHVHTSGKSPLWLSFHIVLRQH